MRNFLLSLLLILSLGPCQVAATSPLPETNLGQDAEKEQQEAQKVVAEFMRRVQETRDIGSLKDLYVSDFVRRSGTSDGDTLGDVGAAALSFDSDLRTRASQNDWERYYAAQVNLRYFVVLRIASALTPTEMRSPELLVEKLFPPDVWAIVDANPFLAALYRPDHPLAKYKVETFEEFYGLIAALEKVDTIMRASFMKSPPEQSKLYKENIERSTPEYLKQGEPKPYLSIASSERYSFPRGSHFFDVITTPPLFELTLVTTGKGVKIAWARVYPFN